MHEKEDYEECKIWPISQLLCFMSNIPIADNNDSPQEFFF